jgi:hypothetical protein
MIPKKPVPDAIRDGYRFSEKIMRQRRHALACQPHRQLHGEHAVRAAALLAVVLWA